MVTFACLVWILQEFHPLLLAVCLASLPDPSSLEDGGRMIWELRSCQMLWDAAAASLLPSFLWANLCLPCRDANLPPLLLPASPRLLPIKSDEDSPRASPRGWP